MVYYGILMETIGIYVMVSIGLLLYCFSRDMIIVRVCETLHDYSSNDKIHKCPAIQ